MSNLSFYVERKNAQRVLEAAAETVALAEATKAAKATETAWSRTISIINRARVQKPADASGWSTAIKNTLGRAKV